MQTVFANRCLQTEPRQRSRASLVNKQLFTNLTKCKQLTYYWDSGASQWWLVPGTLHEDYVFSLSKDGKLGRVEGAYGQYANITARGQLNSYKGTIPVYEVENNQVNLGSVSVTCKALNINMMLTFLG